jgi:hypothetical protein
MPSRLFAAAITGAVAADVATPTHALFGTASGLSVQVFPDGNFSVLLDGQVWFESADVFVRDGGAQRSARAGSLRVAAAGQQQYSGSDAVLGSFNGTNTTFTETSDAAMGGGEVIVLQTSIRQYAASAGADPSASSTLVFEATLPQGLSGSQQPGSVRSAPGLATSFPSFQLPSAAAVVTASQQRSWISYDGWDCNPELGEPGFGCVNLGPEGCVALCARVRACVRACMYVVCMCVRACAAA